MVFDFFYASLLIYSRVYKILNCDLWAKKEVKKIKKFFNLYILIVPLNCFQKFNKSRERKRQLADRCGINISSFD